MENRDWDVNTKMGKIADDLKLDFEVKNDMTLGEYLSDKGYPSLANMLND